ncbi:MAG: class I adenylate-forming enzyme family protein [Sneathiella sp.]
MQIDEAQVFLPELWATHARFSPNKEAVICGDVRRNWKDFNDNMNKIANAVIARGFGRGDKVAVLMGNAVETLEVMYGIVRAGACVVPLSGLLTADQIEVLTNDCGASLIISSQSTHLRIDSIRDRLTNIQSSNFISVEFTSENWTSFVEFLAGCDNSMPVVDYQMTDTFNIIYSSGTTGLPKGIVQTHMARQHWSYSNAIEMRFHTNTIAMTTTALYSNGTWLMILPALFAGGTIIILPEFNSQAFLNIVSKEQITHTFMVPTQFITALADPELDDSDLTSLEAVLCAGSPLRPDTKADVLRRITRNLYELYGFSEGFATMNRPHTQSAKPDSVGTPVLGFDIRILDDDGNELGPGEIGEIAGSGAGMMKEYHGLPELTAPLIWTNSQGRTFIRSGDIGKLDDDGFLYILDRKKDMIISGGLNVFPADIEAIIGENETVRDVTVIGIPHEKWGETPAALVIPNEGASEQSILEWSNQRLAKHQRLAVVIFKEDFPRNALGKVLKRELRESFQLEKDHG